MCVTSAPADINNTRVLTYVTYDGSSHQPMHYTFYQNTATNRSKRPNCMFLQFPTAELEPVVGHEHTRSFLGDITLNLAELEHHPVTRGMSFRGGADRSIETPRVVQQGDYHLVLCSSPRRILDALEQVPVDRRPMRTLELEALAAWYAEWYADESFVLACFNGSVNPRHPIGVRYVPHNDDVVFAPGLDGHTGGLPIIGQDIVRDFHVAFAVQGLQLPVTFRYTDFLGQVQDWAPDPRYGVAGFHDNRFRAPNGDYTVALETLHKGFSGHELVAELIS
jgi:hypothetical protein